MIVKLQFKRGKWAEMMEAYNEMLTYIRTAVTRNYSEKVRPSVLVLGERAPRQDSIASAARKLPPSGLALDLFPPVLCALSGDQQDPRFGVGLAADGAPSGARASFLGMGCRCMRGWVAVACGLPVGMGLPRPEWW